MRSGSNEKHRLCKARVGGTKAEKLKIPADKIVLHSDLFATDDPGPFFPEASFREQLARTR